MLAALLALIALNVVTLLIAARREARLLDALMTRTPQEYIAAKKADRQDKSKPQPETAAAPEFVFPVGL